MKILLIDDEPSVRETLGEHLEEEGHQVRTVGGGEAGLFLLEESPADLVITDLKMPGISGLEVLRRVRERWPATEVVLITGYGTIDDAVEALREGAYDFLLKPVRLAQLDLVIRHCDERIRFARDNRELRRVVEELRKLNERREKFIAIANHELRTPTTVAAGLVSLLSARAGELPEEVRGFVAGADRALRRLKEVVEDLGDLAAAQGKGIPVRPVAEPLEAVGRAVIDLCDLYRELRSLEISVRVPDPAGGSVVLDLRKWTRAAGALIQNAVKFTPDGGRVEVGLTLDRDDLILEVADTGVGIAPEDAETIFDPFYEAGDVRHHRSSSHEFGGGGLGVGLPLARAIAAAHGGTVSYRPRPGGGSVFVLRVPRAGPVG